MVNSDSPYVLDVPIDEPTAFSVCLFGRPGLWDTRIVEPALQWKAGRWLSESNGYFLYRDDHRGICVKSWGSVWGAIEVSTVPVENLLISLVNGKGSLLSPRGL